MSVKEKGVEMSDSDEEQPVELLTRNMTMAEVGSLIQEGVFQMEIDGTHIRLRFDDDCTNHLTE